MVAVRHSPAVIAASSRPRFGLDPILYEANGGALLLWDMANRFCRPLIEPTSGQRVRDLSGYTVPGQPILTDHGDGHIRFAASGTDPTFDEATNGIYFGGAKEGAMIESTAKVAQHIIDSTDQYFMVLLYVTTPDLDDWPAGVATRPWFAFGNSALDYVDGPALLAMGPYLNGATKTFRMHRAKGSAVNSADTLTIDTASTDETTFLQLLGWRNASGVGYRVKTVSRAASATPAAVGTKNTVSGANALTAKVGVPAALNVDGSDENARKVKFHRLYVEDLALSGRDPEEVADDDWQNQIDRGVFV